MKWRLLLGLFICFSQVSLWAAKCARVDNSENLGAPRNQDSVGWCYAFASAELATHKLSQRISPVDIAISYNYFREDTWKERVRRYVNGTKRPLEGGDVLTAMNDIQSLTDGFCPEEELPETEHLGETLRSLYHRNQCLNGNQEDCKYESESAYALLPTLSTEIADEWIRKPMTSTAWHHLTQATCQHRIKLPATTHAIQMRGSNRSSREQLLNRIDQQLDAGNILAMQYDQLQIDKFPWWAQLNVAMDQLTGSITRAVGLADDPSHAVAIVGRRYNETLQTCQYEIRDSDNHNCKYGDATICDPDHRIWYTRESIIRHIHDITYLTDD